MWFNDSSPRFQPMFGDWNLSPWPHSWSNKTFKSSVYKKLRDYYPPDEWIDSSLKNQNYVPGLRSGLGTHHWEWEQYIRHAPPWQEFYEYISGVRFYDLVMKHAGQELEKAMPSHEILYKNMVKPDLYFYSLKEGFDMDMHLDSSMRLMSWVFYFNECHGGEIILGDNESPKKYSPKDNSSVFWINGNYSWHGVSSVKSTRYNAYVSLNHRDRIWDVGRSNSSRPKLPDLSEFTWSPASKDGS